MTRSGINLAGQVQSEGQLTAVCRTEKRQRNSVLWECLCSCGRTVLVTSTNFRYQRVRSCGCRTSMRRKASQEVVAHLRQDGLTMAEIGRQLGVSKQRVGQIIAATRHAAAQQRRESDQS